MTLLVRELNLGSKGRLRPSEHLGQHLADLVRVVVDRLLAEQHEVRLFVARDLREDSRERQRIEVAVALHQDRAVGAHRKPGAKLLLPGRLSDRDQHDFAARLFFLDPQGFFDCDLVERVDNPLDIVGGDTRAVGEDADRGGGVGNTFDWNQNLHSDITPRMRLFGDT